MDKMLLFWIIAGVLFFIIEILTSQIVTIWFAVGAIGAIFASVLDINTLGQIIVFAVVSLLSLLIARPYLKKFTKTQVQPTNADMCIGSDGIVTETIDNTVGTGQVKVRGSVWSAKSFDGSVIEKNSVVTIEAISGVKLIVKKTDIT